MTAITRENIIDRFLLLFGVVLFSTFLFIYMSDFDFRRFLFGSDIFSGREKIGILGSKSGDLRRKFVTAPAFRPIDEKTDLFNHDTVVTDEQGTATLELYDGSVLELGPRTMIKLSFDSEFALSGIGRKTTIEIVSGKIKAQSRTSTKNIVVKVNDETKAVLTKPEIADIVEVPELQPVQIQAQVIPELKVSETVLNLPPPVPIDVPLQVEGVGQVVGVEVARPSPTAIPVPEMSINAMPSVAISAKPEISMSIKMSTPQRAARLKVPAGKLVGEVPILFSWTTQPGNVPILLTVRRKLSQEAFTAKSESGQLTQYEDIFSKEIRSNTRNYRESLTIKKPGDYEWELKPVGDIFTLTSKGNPSRAFSIAREAGEIKIENPLIAGQKENSNRYMGKIIKDFDVSLQWDAIANPEHYRVRFYRSKSGGSPFFDKKVNSNRFQLESKDVPKQTTFFEVAAVSKEGFHWSSERKGFRFDFSPPFLKHPKNDSVINWDLLKDEDFYEIFTWERTNFTLNYDVEIARDEDFKRVLVKKTTNNNFININITEKGTYYWRVKSLGEGFVSLPSPTRKFEVK